ncbi:MULTISPECIES: EAL domain-containing response regulator [unclassified Nitratiruptor]|uniref:EAL domain-containing response regulator n=1 Tax=unclassified Nitratiruptor TaxID=2624044 RepID=UPI00191684AF|nr:MULTISPECIES: EAL domain-containing response regulator [unclassified Nitratiruptor]BCD59869.1 diguanylate cyclase/phosphodiesterase [Nitratiruptor sp. YY08-10]BCD63792.1 diguanylate cyclase/phosphodiesterase [Nitratiruptor sp. YY08-14]
MNDYNFKNLTFLFVEDEKIIRDNIYDILSPFFKKIYVAKNGQEGLEIFKNHEDIDLIVTDIVMPEMDGISMVDAIREFDKEVPIIYVTAFSESDLLIKTIKQKICGYILKPIDVEELLKAIKKAGEIIEAKRLREKLKDINEYLQKEIEKKTEELRKIAFYDELTNLPNRNSLIQDLKRLEKPIVVLLDIDSFKTINDIYGIENGNYVLKEFSGFLKIFEKKYGGKFYRSGSDEFVWLQDNHFEEEKYKKIIEDMIEFISSQKIYLKGYDLGIFVDITIGVGFGKENPLEKADMALSKAIENHQRYYILKNDDTLKKEYEHYMEILKTIKIAIREDGIVPYLQSIVDKDGNINYYEALIRIKTGSTVLVPYQFLEISKKAKLYNKLSSVMIDKSMQIAKEFDRHISINLSYQDLDNKKNMEEIIQKVKYYDIGKKMVFEITENEAIRDFNNILKFIEIVKKYGVKIAIDDFGSGYSNFEYLLKMKPDLIKIDGSLIKEILVNEEAQYIVETISHFSKKLHIQTVAEFVSSQKIFEKLKELNVDKFQGYFFDKPKSYV